MSFEIVPAWRQVDDALAGELGGFWRGHGAMPAAEAARRARQAVCIGRDEAGAVCAVGTAELVVLPRLRQPTYYYRQFFGPAHRGRGMGLPFLVRAREILQAHNASLPEPESIGLVVEVESRMLAERYTLAHEPASGFTFIGYSPRGLVLRASYFDGARLLPPGRQRRRPDPA